MKRILFITVTVIVLPTAALVRVPITLAQEQRHPDDLDKPAVVSESVEKAKKLLSETDELAEKLRGWLNDENIHASFRFDCARALGRLSRLLKK